MVKKDQSISERAYMDSHVQGSFTKSSLSPKHIESVAIVRNHARYVVELNAQGRVRKIKSNKEGGLNVLAVTMPHAGPNTRHGIVLEIGMGKHRPYARTRECLTRLQYRTLDSEELAQILPTLESLLDYRRAAVVTGWKVATPIWIEQDQSHWRKFERGIFVAVAIRDQALYYAFCGADLEFRRAAYPIDFYAFLIRYWLKGYKKEVYTQAEFKRMKHLHKAVDVVRQARGPFVERFYVGKRARLLSLIAGRELTGEIPPYLPLLKISARYVNPERTVLKGQIRKTKRAESGLEIFEVLSLEAKETMRKNKALPRLHGDPPEGCTPEWEEWIKKELLRRYEGEKARHAMPAD